MSRTFGRFLKFTIDLLSSWKIRLWVGETFAANSNLLSWLVILILYAIELRFLTEVILDFTDYGEVT